MANEEEIALLEAFKKKLIDWRKHYTQETRSELNHDKHRVRQIVMEAGCFMTMTISPPPAVGGLIYRNVDLFDHMFEEIYFESPIPKIIDMIDQAIGVLKLPPQPQKASPAPAVEYDIRKNFAFVAMPINPEQPELIDVLDSIKEACDRCGIQAERVDDEKSNERITDRILQSIRRAEYVIVDLTHPKPNVFFEAGYSHGLGKTPIYIARHGTTPEFDVKDYPIIFFKNFKALKDQLESRLRGLPKH